jgi:hypothetical protein
MTYATHEKQLKHALRRGRLFSEIEEWIDHAPLSEDEKSALWLCAWSHGHRRVAPGWGPGPGRPEDLQAPIAAPRRFGRLRLCAGEGKSLRRAFALADAGRERTLFSSDGDLRATDVEHARVPAQLPGNSRSFANSSAARARAARPPPSTNSTRRCVLSHALRQSAPRSPSATPATASPRRRAPRSARPRPDLRTGRAAAARGPVDGRLHP